MLIAIEGADGCGKDTVANMVAGLLGAERLNFPNRETLTGRMIDAYLKRRWQVACIDARIENVEAVEGAIKVVTDAPELSALAFQALQIANRMEVMPRLFNAVVTDHDLVLARYWQSGWVYGQLDGLDPDWLFEVHKGMAQPILNVLLDVPAEVCLARRAARDGRAGPEFYEGKLDKVQRIVGMYRDLWDWKFPKYERVGRWLVLDGQRSPTDLAASIIQTLADWPAPGRSD